MRSIRTRGLKAGLVTEDAEPQEGSPRALSLVASARGLCSLQEAPASRDVFPWRLCYVFRTRRVLKCFRVGWLRISSCEQPSVSLPLTLQNPHSSGTHPKRFLGFLIAVHVESQDLQWILALQEKPAL